MRLRKGRRPREQGCIPWRPAEPSLTEAKENTVRPALEVGPRKPLDGVLHANGW
jgi:hypothetical protein